MPFRLRPIEQLRLAFYLMRWALIAAPIAALIGSACALFLWSLDLAIHAQWDHPWLLWLLPAAGVGIVLLYRAAGGGADKGNNLILEEIHLPRAGIPPLMAPLILITTVVTHLFGGSAGREGTAVQMGGSLASTVGRALRLSAKEVRMLLMLGMAAGFGGVFGTPLAGAIFAIEVCAIGRLSYEAIFPCLVAGLIGDWSCGAWGIHHTQYRIAVGPTPFEWSMAWKVAVAAVAFGLAGLLFSEMTHGLSALWARLGGRLSRRGVLRVAKAPPAAASKGKFTAGLGLDLLRPVVGGLAIILLVHVLGTRDYLSLGVRAPSPGGVSILSSFSPGGAHPSSWLWKIIFTAVTLSSGFKGGEVTPLFFVGAALGNTLAGVLGAPVDLFAALGLVAVFAGASNTPLACTLMGIELFGANHAANMALACFIAYLFSGHSGIYLSQRVGTPKGPLSGPDAETTLGDLRE